MTAAAASENLLNAGTTAARGSSHSARALRTLRRRPTALVGMAIVVGWLILGILAPVLPIDDPNVQDLSLRLKPPSSGHILGTDDLGRDMASRVIYGARVSVPAGMLVIA